MRLRYRPLMVTQDSDETVGFIVCIELLLRCPDFGCDQVELLLERDRGVICTEHLRSQTLHV